MTAASAPHLAFLGQGGDYHIHKWLPALAEQGLAVTLLSFTPPPEPLPGVRFEPLTPWLRRDATKRRYLDYFTPVRGLRKRLHALEVDVLLGSYATHYGWMAARTGLRPLIIQTWTGDVSLYPWQGWKGPWFRHIVRRTLHAADAILTDGTALADLTRTRFPEVADRVVPTRWGIRLADYDPEPGLRDKTRAAWGIPAEAPVVASVRGVKASCRPEVVLPALQALLGHDPAVHVLVLTLGHTCPPASQPTLDALVAHPRAHIFDRFLTTQEMQAVWAVSDILVSMPLHDGISEAVLEGLYAGVLPVLSDAPSNRSLLADGVQAFTVGGHAPAALHAVLVEAVAQRPRLLDTWRPANRRWVANHASVEQTARQVAALVRRLASGQPVGPVTPSAMR